MGTLAAIVLTGTAAAYVAELQGGRGEGAASSGALTISAAATDSQPVVPTGAPSGGLAVRVDNRTGARVHIDRLGLAARRGRRGYSANVAGCGISYAAQDNGGSGWVVPTGRSRLDLRHSLTMAPTAPERCQGRAVLVHLRATWRPAP